MFLWLIISIRLLLYVHDVLVCAYRYWEIGCELFTGGCRAFHIYPSHFIYVYRILNTSSADAGLNKFMTCLPVLGNRLRIMYWWVLCYI